MKGKLIEMTLTSLLLVACGSGSSQGSSQPSDSSQSSGASQSKPSNKLNGKDNTTYYTTGFVLKGDTTYETPSAQTDTLNKIVLDDTEIDLLPENYGKGAFYESHSSDMYKLIGGSQYDYMRFGVIKLSKDGKDEVSAFTQGFPSWDNIPKTGTAIYEGEAVGFVYNSGMTDWARGKSRLTVDFATPINHISGTLFNWDNDVLKNINFQGTIVGGHTFFDSTRLYTGEVQSVRGEFYGNNAEEVGGHIRTAQDGKTVLAAFGAQKQ